MAKSKNHTNHNQNKKAHRNGIKKVQKKPFRSLKGLDAKFKKNQKFARKGVMKIQRKKNLKKRNARLSGVLPTQSGKPKSKRSTVKRAHKSEAQIIEDKILRVSEILGQVRRKPQSSPKNPTAAKPKSPQKPVKTHAK